MWSSTAGGGSALPTLLGGHLHEARAAEAQRRWGVARLPEGTTAFGGSEGHGEQLVGGWIPVAVRERQWRDPWHGGAAHGGGGGATGGAVTGFVDACSGEVEV